jgi:hypothetical protein
MFGNNPFLTKKDPLVEAVQGAMQDGNLRRQAEALVNEEFGVYSRKAVVREQLAAYDARLEEAYKCMKEGDVENIMNPNSNWAKKQAADKSNPFNEPTPDPTKVAPNIMMKGAGGDGTRTIGDKVKSLFKEGKKADKDYDKDGKIESPKDEVWGSRLRAAKKAGKLKEGAIDAGSMEGSKSVTKSAPKEDPSLPKSYPGAASTVKGPNPTSQRMSNAVKENVTAPKDWSEKRHPNKNAVTKAPVPGVSIAEDQVDEAAYSAKAARAGKDIGKPGKMFKKIAKKAGAKYGSEERGKAVAGKILQRIRAKHMKEENLEELSAFGKAFAAAKGQNFSFGGKSYSGARADGKTPGLPATPKPAPTNTPGTQGVATGKSFAAIDQARNAAADKAATASIKQSVSGTDYAKSSSPAPKTDTAGTQGVATGKSFAAIDAAKTPAAPTATASAPAAQKNKEAGSLPRNMAESVEVGENKYRIV